MSQPSFPGGTSSSSSFNNNVPADEYTNDGNMEEYERRWAERNSEETHKAALAAARARHDAIRERALGVLEIEQLREETEKLRQKRIQTQERVRLETERAMEEVRIREEENKAKQIPEPPPRVPTPPQPVQQSIQKPKQTTTTSTPAPAVQQASQSTQAPGQASPPNPFQSSQTQPPPNTSQPNLKQLAHQQSLQSHFKAQTQPVAQQPKPAQSQLGTQQEKRAQQPTQAPSMALPPPQSQPNFSQATSAAQIATKNLKAQETVNQSIDRYADIHQTLKKLRKVIREHGEKDSQFKKAAGEMRRAITRSVGQLTEGKGVNKVQLQTITAQLDASLAMPIPVQFQNDLLFPPELVMTQPPKPSRDKDTPNSGDRMPSLTIYLLNILAKAAISQFCTEAGANPKAADPIGMIVVSVFAQAKYSWRGQALVEILIAKFRVVCPVLFGVRGNEKTEEGRARLGWKKDVNNNWISEQEHNDRMTGLGAGWASISLRNFSRTTLTNPWTPIHYWASLSLITATPSGETSSTQFIVLKAMVDNYTAIFLQYFGNMGTYALHVTLEEFPRRAEPGNVAASSLQVLAAKLKRDTGLQLSVH